MSGNAYTLWGADHHADAPLLESLWEDHASAPQDRVPSFAHKKPDRTLCEPTGPLSAWGADPVIELDSITGTRFNPQQDSGVPGLTAQQ